MKRFFFCVYLLIVLTFISVSAHAEPILINAIVTNQGIQLSPDHIPENKAFTIHVINQTKLPVEIENSDTSVEIYANMDRTFKVGLTAGTYIFFNDFNTQTKAATLFVKSLPVLVRAENRQAAAANDKSSSLNTSEILFIIWRESVEALLVVGVVYSWLTQLKAGRRSGFLFLWLGVLVGLIFAFLLSFILIKMNHILTPDFANLFQAGMALVAAGMIIYMIKWMREKGRALKSSMHHSLEKNTSSFWRNISILTVVSVALAREASEASIFVYALGFENMTGSPFKMMGIIGLGISLAIATIFLLQLGNRIFSWRFFFKVTEILLLLLGGGLILNCIDRLIVSGVLSPLQTKIWNTSFLLSDGGFFAPILSSFTGYRASPSLMDLIAYGLYWAIIYFLLKVKKSADYAD